MEEAERAFRSAEERFLVGDVDGALRVARNAKRHSASLPALQSALTAYEVHDAESGRGRNCWYAVLSVGVGQPEPVTHDHDAIKKRYKRLCLVLHPDKNRSAAADGAFKLLQRAWEVLSARHPPGTVPDPGPKPRPPTAGAPNPAPGPKPRPRQPPAGAPNPGPKPRPRPTPAGAPDPDDGWSGYFRNKPKRPPPPFSSASTSNFNAWRSRYARKKGTTYCGHCSSQSESAVGDGHRGTPGGRCHSCGTPFDPPPPRQSPAEGASAPPPAGTAAEPPPRNPPPRQSQAEGASDPPPAGTGAEPPPRDPPPPPPPRRQRDDGEKQFTCPTECSRCKTPFSSLVSPGMCKLTCQACSYDAFVYVHDRHWAIAF